MSDLAPGTIVDGKYRIEGLLGQGGMGVVYRATQIALGRQIALKVLLRDLGRGTKAPERFRREALAVARLRHPNIVTVHDFAEADGVGAYIVLELLEGATLQEELARRGRLPVPLALDVARQVATALSAAHDAGVVHRDLKPSNVILEPDGTGVRAKVLDFGIAQLLDERGSPIERVTVDGALVGTPVYMSPEQCEGGELDARSDLYSLACVLYEMLTGRPPFVAESLMAIIRMHVFAPVDPPSRYAPELQRAFDTLLLHALAKAPGDRFQSAADFARALSENLPAVAPAPSTPVPYSGPTNAGIAPTQVVPETNLHHPVTNFVGRERDLEEAGAALEGARLVTLTGPGGVGKTRLAVEIAWKLIERFAGGVWFVDLAAVSDPALVADAVAAAVRARMEAGVPVDKAIAEALAAGRSLVVLDNCEHLVAACAALVERLLRACPELTVVATSREPLAVAGETVWQVRPLDVTAGGESEAVALFADRARLRDRTFAVDLRSAETVARICRRLDGIPLAIELAAARAKVLSLDKLLSRLDDRFRLLNSGDRTAAARHQTLRATIDWSYELLDEDERNLFRRLAVFAGFTIEAAEEGVRGQGSGVREDGPVSPTPSSALDLLAALVDKSLVVAEVQYEEPRYRMLETIREYALERLAESGCEADTRRRHAEWFHDFVDRSEYEVDGPNQRVWLDRIEADLDNVRTALSHFAAHGDWNAYANLAGKLMQFWLVRGSWAEGRAWLSRVPGHEAEMSEASLARALYSLGVVELYANELDAAEAHLGAAVEINRRIDDKPRVAASLRMLGSAASRKGDSARAVAHMEECLALYRASSDAQHVGWALSGLGIANMDAGDDDRAVVHFEEALALFRSLGSVQQTASTLHNIGDIALRRGELDRAEAIFEECRETGSNVGDRLLIAVNTLFLGRVAAARGDRELARERYEAALADYREIGDEEGVAVALEALADTRSRER